MGFYQFKGSQILDTTQDELWDMISSPANLKRITPPYMGFDITSGDLPEKMYPGMIITYLVKPVLGIPTEWVTEITHVEEGRFFVDEQRVGPYALWHHQHHIEPISGGKMLMRDIVSYQPPFGFLGDLANALFIRRKLEEIFNYRRKALEQIYPPRNP